MKAFEKKIFEITSKSEFENLALEIFNYQSQHCFVYEQYLKLIEVAPKKVSAIEQIPFLPVQFYKTREIIADSKTPEIVFTSSSTTGMTPSKHFVASLKLYEMSFLESFKTFYGNPSEYAILSLLPSYLEREGSSLVYMANKLMVLSGNPHNGFYLYNHSELFKTLSILKKEGIRTILLGVSFALLDFIKEYQPEFPELIVIETGGMKGRGKELSREEIHSILKKGIGVPQIHSEYGMAELLSQAYSTGDGLFKSPPWMNIYIRDLQNPFKFLPHNKKGGVNIIDLANIYSCSFIETEDSGIKETGDSFRITGRVSNSEIRGCNLLLG